MNSNSRSGPGGTTLALVCAAALTGCGSDDAGSGGTAKGLAGADGGEVKATADGGETTKSADGGETTGTAGGGDAAAAVEPCVPDESGPVPERDTVGEWVRVDLPGAVCSDGSQYPIFVNYSDTSNNVIMMLEPGGACWDYESCSPDGGLRGAANPNGIEDGIQHMTTRWGFLPLMRRDEDINPVHDWNLVFLPYCTGDIHTGNNTVTYTGPNGETLEFRHHGHENVQKATEWVNETFADIPRLFVTGCSAGGAGSILNYHFIRQGIDGEQCSYLLDDSGPIFPSSGNSAPLHAKVRESWNVDPIIDSLEGEIPGITVEDIKQDFGLINEALAKKYPQDRLAITLYRWDLNYSLYSYDSFYDFPGYMRIHELWEEDVASMRDQYDAYDNLAYFIPYFRIDNCSHCVSIPPIGLDGSDLAKALNDPWLGSEIQEDGLNLRDYVVDLLDDRAPLESYFESEQPDEGFTADEAAVCEGL